MNISVEIRNVNTLHYLHNWYLFILSRMVGRTLLQISEWDNVSTRGPLQVRHSQQLFAGHSGWSRGDCEEKSVEQSFLRRTGSVCGSNLSASYFLSDFVFQENEPGTATFMEDSARDAGTVILAEVIRRCWMILYFMMINIQTRHRQKGLEQ